MLDSLISQLKDPSRDARSAARAELQKFARSGTASIDDAMKMITAATGDFPDPENEWEDPSSPLLWAVCDLARDKDPAALIPAIQKVFATLTPASRSAALGVLVLAATRQAASAYVDLLASYGDALGPGILPEFEPRSGPEVARALFPRLIGVVRNPKLAFPVLHTLLEFRQADLVPPDVAREYHGSLARVLQAEVSQARALQRPTGLGWRDDTPYAEHRDMIGLLFDLAGTLSSTTLLKVVAGASDLVDPRLRRFRAISLLRRGQEVPRSELDWIARSPRDRFWMFDQLNTLGRPDLLPDACLDQARLAEGNMVDWLCFGTELGREPDEIVLIHTETRRRSEAKLLVRWLSKREPVDYYFFKYRVTEEHWSREKGWMVGMAGGYARSEQPTTRHDGGTFSTFDPLDEKTLADHVAAYLE